jgi:transposase-like protein
VCAGTYSSNSVTETFPNWPGNSACASPPARSCDLVVRYAPEFEPCWQAYERPVGDSWRCDETYLKVNGEWVSLYRAVDKQGKTVESYLSRTRDIAAAKAFFRKAFRRHGDPRVITLEGFEPSHAALRRMGMNNEFNFRWDNPVQIRTCAYLNRSYALC